MKTLDVLQALFDKHQVHILEFQGKCHDCEAEVSVEFEMDPKGKVERRGGYLYTPDDTALNHDQKFLKCEDCFAKDPVLRDWQECEVFARVVGYLRATRQWNKGKKSEYVNRVNFDMEGYK